MTARERFTAIIEGHVPDALPLVADLSYWYHARREEGKLDTRYEGDEGYIRLHEDLGCVFYYDYGGGRIWSLSSDDCEEESLTSGYETIHRIRTRSGELIGRSRYIPESHCGAVVEHMVKRSEDLKIVREYMESLRYSPCFHHYLKRQDYIGERGVSIVCLPQSPLGALLVRWAGVETTTYLAVDSTEEFEMTLQCIEETVKPAFRIACESPASLFHFTDNLSADTVGGFFSRYLAPYYKRRLEELHTAGKKAVTHLDGKIGGLLGQVAATGMDGIEALTTGPVGDIDLADLRAEAASEDVVLWGGLPGALFSCPYGRTDVLRQVESIHKLFGTAGRFIPGTADQVPPDADIELVRMAAEALSKG